MPITILWISHEQSHPIPIIPSPTAGELLTNGWGHHGWLMERRCWWWRWWSPLIPRPGRVPEQRLLIPIWGFGMAAAKRKSSGKTIASPKVFRSEGVYSPKGRSRGCPGRPHHPQARPGVDPFLDQVWAPRGPSALLLLAHWIFWLKNNFYRFTSWFPESWISAHKQDTKAILLKTALVRVSFIQKHTR